MTVNVQWVDPSSKLELVVTASTILTPGDIAYWDGSGLIKADADAVASAAEWIVVNRGDGDSKENSKAIVAKRCTLYDTAAGFTVGPYYNSVTAGEYTTTRPTGALDVRQQIGYAHTTSYLSIDIKERREVEVIGSVVLLAASAALLVYDGGPAAGHVLAAVSDAVTYAFPIPANAVAIKAGVILYGADVTLDATDTMSASIASAALGEDNSVVTDTISATALTLTTNLIGEFNLITGLNAAGICKPGGMLWIKCNKAAEGAGGDDPTLFPPVVTFEVV